MVERLLCKVAGVHEESDQHYAALLIQAVEEQH